MQVPKDILKVMGGRSRIAGPGPQRWAIYLKRLAQVFRRDTHAMQRVRIQRPSDKRAIIQHALEP